jgi:hypothetical protein
MIYDTIKRKAEKRKSLPITFVNQRERHLLNKSRLLHHGDKYNLFRFNFEYRKMLESSEPECMD